MTEVWSEDGKMKELW